MVKAGELGGVLEVVLVRLAEYAEKAAKLKSKLTTAMVYPCYCAVYRSWYLDFPLTRGGA